MRLAVECGARWSLFLDADVLLKRDAISEMLREGEAISTSFYMLNFRILDRGFGGPAYGGVHLYATKHLSTALQFQDLARGAQRPESRLCVEMARQIRIPTLSSTQLVGLHGYEQFYADLYRTTFVRAVKFSKGFSYMLRRYRSEYDDGNGDDQDNKVMLWGLLDGTLYKLDHEKAPLDARFYEKHASRALSMLGIPEKGPFLLGQDRIECILHGYTPDDHYRANEHWICRSASIAVPVPDRSLRKRIRRRICQCLLSLGRRAKKMITAAIHD